MIGQNLKKIRKEKKLTQLDVANHLNISRTTYSSYEMERRTPNIESLKAMSNYFEISIDCILCEVNSCINTNQKYINECSELIKKLKTALYGNERSQFTQKDKEDLIEIAKVLGKRKNT